MVDSWQIEAMVNGQWFSGGARSVIVFTIDDSRLSPNKKGESF
jgi:hypothetical protein